MEFINTRNNWEIFENWNIKQEKISWEVFNELKPNYVRVFNYKKNKYKKLIEKWDVLLNHLGKDPSHINWDNFRPLRLSREEDWSDWLAFLIEQSTTGFFSKNIFKINSFNQNDYINPIKVLREESDFSKSYRADIIIKWKNKKYTHLEIKTGDKNLSKTFIASKNFRKTFNSSKNDWTNYILLLPNQLSNWDSILPYNNIECKINSITWKDISIIIRKSLLLSDEAINWKVWAYSFTGIIEQKLLGLNNYWNSNEIPVSINQKIEILEKSLKNE